MFGVSTFIYNLALALKILGMSLYVYICWFFLKYTNEYLSLTSHTLK